MVRIKAKTILLVSPRMLSGQAVHAYKKITHITDPAQIFPSLFELKPDLLIFDADFLGDHLERIIRRIRSNSFYDKTRICCYRNSFKTSEESLLKTLGVNDLIEGREAETAHKLSGFSGAVNALLNPALNPLAV